MLAAQGEDVHHIARQVGHATTALTQDIYRHVFAQVRVEAMRRLNTAIPPEHQEQAGRRGRGTPRKTER
jgi:integrase